MTDNTQPEAREFTMSQYASKYDMIGAMRKRIAELEAELEAVGAGGVQALSAAPEAIAKLRHLYQNMVNGAVRDTASAKRIAEGLLAPAIEAVERATPPAEQQAAPKAAPGELAASAAKGAIMGAAYDFRDAHISGSMNLKRSAHAALEDAVDNALAAQSAPQQEAQEPTTVDKKTMELAESVGLIGPASRVGDLHAAIQRFHDLICVNATIKAAVMAAEVIGKQQAAPQQGAQKPIAWLEYARKKPSLRRLVFTKTSDKELRAKGWLAEPLSTPAPQPSPAPLSDDVVKDAARYRWLRATTNYVTSNGERIDVRNMPEKWDAAIDAALAAQGGKA